jgi:hypothetical protein
MRQWFHRRSNLTQAAVERHVEARIERRQRSHHATAAGERPVDGP